MKLFYKICIVFTACVALFFFIRLINEVRPRYEWQESFTTDISRRCFSFNDDCYSYCQTTEIKERFYTNGGSNSEIGEAEIIICYRKEKIKIK